MSFILKFAVFFICYIFNVHCAPQSSQFSCKINKHVPVCMYVIIIMNGDWLYANRQRRRPHWGMARLSCSAVWLGCAYRRRQIGIIVGTVISCLLIISAIIIIVVYQCRKKAMDEKKTVETVAQIIGATEVSWPYACTASLCRLLEMHWVSVNWQSLWDTCQFA